MHQLPSPQGRQITLSPTDRSFLQVEGGERRNNLAST
ncbi:hypothetical protein QC761_303165 [Podospora bellae-mahoneyi]|uniref:Uncharacterized protein n=1 Tax=Podospora bellae-mahoneyi TaxID=2093777 RepID=A0ABR0FJV5_9PEZI|nr:hypothetical protein QC761_303165 [Podospora bellae-mahoneyi]